MRLGLCEAHFLGHLEMLWRVADNCGDTRISRDLVGLEAACGWEGPEGALAELLISQGWVERDGEWYELSAFWYHAPSHTRRRAIRRGNLEPRRLPSGFVYVIQCGDLYKIGYSVDPERRMRSIPVDGTVAPSGPLSLLLQIPAQGMRDLERAFHQRYAAVHRFGEWFALEPWMLAELENEVPL